MSKAAGMQRERSLAGKLLASAGSSWARILVFFAVSFILTPVLIQELGVDLFGVFMLVSVSMALAGPLRGAIRKTITRELTTAISSRDAGRIRETFSNGVLLGAIGAGIAVLVTVALALGAPVVLRVSPEHQHLLAIAVALEGLLIAQLIALMAWHNLFFATHRIIEENAHRALNRGLDLIAIGLAMVLPVPSIFLGFVFIRFGLHTLHHLLKAWRARALVPAARISTTDMKLSAVRSMASIGGWSTANQIARLGFYQSDQILLNLFFGPVYNGLYAVVNQLRSWSRMFGGNVAFGVDAIAADLHEKGDRDAQVRMLLSVMKITGSITAFFAITAAVCAAPLVNLWLGSRLSGDEALLEVMSYEEALALIGAFVLVIAPSSIIAETHTSAANVFYGMGLIRTYSIPMLIAAAAKVVIAVIALAVTGDPLWVVWSTLITQFALYTGVFGWMAVRHVGASVSELLVEVYGRGIIATLPVALVGIAYNRANVPLSLMQLLISLALMGALYSALFLTVCLNVRERRRLWRMGTNILGRVSGKLRRSAPSG